jgi:hypothetical protein
MFFRDDSKVPARFDGCSIIVFNDCGMGPTAMFIMESCVARVLRALFSAILSRPA